MSDSKYARYLNQEPRITQMVHHDINDVKGRSWPTRVYMSRDIVPGCNIFVSLGYIYGMPDPNPHMFEHVHDSDEVVMHIGTDFDNPTDLGAEIDFQVEDEVLTMDKTCAIYLPGGVKHGPLTWKRFTRPHLQVAITASGKYD